MDYVYKLTTHGRAVLATCMASEAPFQITRVAFGSGLIDEKINLADVHELLQAVSDGAITERRHEDDRLYLTIQFANVQHPEVKTFLLTEFMVYVHNPETGQETDLIYGSLGDYRQPVPAYHSAFPPSVFNFPLILILSDEINVAVSAPAGLVTYDDLRRMAQEGQLGVTHAEFTIPVSGWQQNQEENIPYSFVFDLKNDAITERMTPVLTILPESTSVAEICMFAPFAQTLNGSLRIWAKAIPTESVKANLTLLGDVGSYLSTSGESLFAIPIASTEEVGSVKIGDGLKIAEDGTLSVNAASEEEINAMFSEVLNPDNK